MQQRELPRSFWFLLVLAAVALVAIISIQFYKVLGGSSNTVKIDLLSAEDAQPAPPAVHKLAECLTARGARLYSASYCGPCIEQKRLFGDAVKKLVIFECNDEGAGYAACRKAYISEAPTWTFPGQEPVHGLQSLDALAERAGCPKP